MYHCGCHGNLVTIATRYAADIAYLPKEPPYQIWTLWLPWSIPNMDPIRLKTKELQSKMYLTQTQIQTQTLDSTKAANSPAAGHFHPDELST